MASETIQSDAINPMEAKLIAGGNTIIVNRHLPNDVMLERPPNALIGQKQALLKDCNPDTTMSFRDIKTKQVVGILFLLLVMGAFLFMMKADNKPQYNAYHSLKPKEVTELVSIPINEATILATNSEDDPKISKGGMFGSSKVKIGDKVVAQEDKNLFDANGKGRNFNTPLLIVANGSKTFGSRSTGEKLTIPTNTYAYVYLERDLMTGNLSTPVSAVTYIDVKSGNKVILPKGSRLIGQCQSINGNRIQIRFESVIFADGREYSIDGLALGDDNIAGVAGAVNRNIAKKTGNLFASSLLGAAAQTMSITGNSFGTILAGNVAENTSDSLENVVDDSASRSGMTIKVSANTRFKIVFE